MHPPKLMNLIIWNANSITPKKDDLLNFLTDNDIAAAMIGETMLKPQTNFQLANFVTYRTDRISKHGGGTAVIVDAKICHHQIVLPPLITIEATGVEIMTRNGPLRLVAVYCPPGVKMDTADIDRLLDSNLPTVLGGDLNAKNRAWNSRVNNTRGNALLARSRTQGFTVSGPAEPTHYQGSCTPDVLDVAVTMGFQQSFDLETITALTSDHLPVLMRVGDVCEPIQQQTRYNFREANWKLYREELDLRISTGPIESTAELDKAVEQLTKAIQDARTASVPIAGPQRCTIFDLPTRIKLSIKIRNRARRLWQEIKTPDLKQRYKCLDRKVKEQIQEYRAHKWEKATSKLELNSRPLWTMTKRLTRKKIPCPPIQGKTHLACSPKDKAEVLADSLQLQFEPNASNTVSPEVQQSLQDHRTNHDPKTKAKNADLCTNEEIISFIKKIPGHKAPGHDDITNQMLKELSLSAVTRLVSIFNAAYTLQHFPTPWKTAKVIVFPKEGKNLRDPTSYRPISLLSTLSKRFEESILARLNYHIQDNNILINEQFGFRTKHSTTQQLLRVSSKIIEGFNKNEMSGIVFLDVAKAFDRVWHDGLLSKMIHMQFPPYLINLIQSYLSSRSFFVYINNASSTVRPILAGVPQGSIVGPVLFNLFTNDIPTVHNKVELALYADDAAIISQSTNTHELGRQLQPALDDISAWYSRNRIALNVGKTKATCFSQKGRPDTPTITLNGETVSWDSSSVYLGVVLDSKLTWKDHVNRVTSKANGKLAALRPILRSKSMPMNSKLQIIRGIIVPGLTYASPVWSGCRSAQLKQLQTVQNRALKIALRVPTYTRTKFVHRILRQQYIVETIYHLNQGFYKTLEKGHPNPLIAALQ